MTSQRVIMAHYISVECCVLFSVISVLGWYLRQGNAPCHERVWRIASWKHVSFLL